MTGKRFALNEGTLAIEVVEGERRAVSIPAWAIIEVLSDNDDRTVNALWESRRVEIFTVDLNMRALEIKRRRRAGCTGTASSPASS